MPIEKAAALNQDINHDLNENHDSKSLHIISTLCSMLNEENISYCHWKSNDAIALSESGDNDLDLLVSRPDVEKFTKILHLLGFKQAKAPYAKQMPGVIDYFGFDQRSDKIIHVHAHYKLVIGHDLTKNYRLPIEKQYIMSATQRNLFKIPQIEYEYIVFVIRMILKHFSLDVMIHGYGRMKKAEKKELSYLNSKVDLSRVEKILKKDLPNIRFELFKSCVNALSANCSVWYRIKIARRLQNELQSNSFFSYNIDIGLKLWYRFILAIQRRLNKPALKYSLLNGGGMIAVIGGDGSGKSTAVDGIYTWLSKYFNTTCTHLGKPGWSLTTTTVRGFLKIFQLLGFYPVESSLTETLQQKSLISPGYPWLFREVCRARDRYRTYLKARRKAARGGLVILDRYPISQVRKMDGPQTEYFIQKMMRGPYSDQFLAPDINSKIARKLVHIEEKYYNRIALPEISFVLRLNPEIAVQRRSDEDENFVRKRNTEIWQMNWESTDTHVVDGSNSKREVLDEIKRLIWGTL